MDYIHYLFMAVRGDFFHIAFDTKEEGRTEKNFSSRAEFDEFWSEHVNSGALDDNTTIMCSSTVDFPEDSTEKEWIIELAHTLREAA